MDANKNITIVQIIKKNYLVSLILIQVKSVFGYTINVMKKIAKTPHHNWEQTRTAMNFLKDAQPSLMEVVLKNPNAQTTKFLMPVWVICMEKAAYGMELNVLIVLAIMLQKRIPQMNNVNKFIKFAWRMARDVHTILDVHLQRKNNIVLGMGMGRNAFGMVIRAH